MTCPHCGRAVGSRLLWRGRHEVRCARWQAERQRPSEHLAAALLVLALLALGAWPLATLVGAGR